MSCEIITAEAEDGVAHASDPAHVPWWSFGKTALAAAALLLAEQGRLALDRPMTPHPFTLRQVLQHRAGLPDYGDLPEYHAAVERGDPAWTFEEMLRRVGADRLLFPPRQGWKYSNVGYAMVRAWVAGAASLPLGPALDGLVFRPLGIGDVRLVLTPSELGDCWGVAPGYDPGWVYPGMLAGPASSAVAFLSGLLSGRLLRPDSLAALRSPHLVDGPVAGRPWLSAGYGLGLMIGQGTPDAIYTGHSGGGPGSTNAVYQCCAGRVAAAFARDPHPDRAERAAMALAFKAA